MGEKDGLFDDDTKTPADTPTDPNTADPTPNTDDVVAMAVREGLGSLRPVFDALEKRLGSLEANTAPREPDPDPTDAANDDPLSRFTGDPDGYIQKQTSKVIEGSLGPLLQNWANDKTTRMLTEASTNFDNKFGEGKFAEHIAGDLGEVLKNMDPALRTSERHFNTAIDSLIGKKVDDLADARQEQSQTMKDRARVPQMLPGGRPRPPAGQLDEEEIEFMTELTKHTGDKIDKRQWVADRERGNTEDDWVPQIHKEMADAS